MNGFYRIYRRKPPSTLATFDAKDVERAIDEANEAFQEALDLKKPREEAEQARRSRMEAMWGDGRQAAADAASGGAAEDDRLTLADRIKQLIDGEISTIEPELLSGFENLTAAALTYWHFGGESGRSDKHFDQLRSMFAQPWYSHNDAAHHTPKAGEARKVLEASVRASPSAPVTTKIKLHVPIPNQKVRLSQECRADGRQAFTIDVDFVHRPLLPSIIQLLQSPSAQAAVFEPYETYADLGGGRSTRVRSEMYNSDEMLSYGDQLHQEEAPAPPSAVLASSLGSDDVQLASHSDVSAHPVLISLANLPKAVRASPIASAISLLYFVPKVSSGDETSIRLIAQLPDDLEHMYSIQTQSQLPAEVSAFLEQQLFHRCLETIFGESDVIHARKNGFRHICPDGIERRLFLRILNWAADFPEQYVSSSLSSLRSSRRLLLLVRNMAERPCVRCLIKSSQLGDAGSDADIRMRSRERQWTSDLFEQQSEMYNNIIGGRSSVAKTAKVLNAKLHSMFAVKVRSLSSECVSLLAARPRKSHCRRSLPAEPCYRLRSTSWLVHWGVQDRVQVHGGAG